MPHRHSLRRLCRASEYLRLAQRLVVSKLALLTPPPPPLATHSPPPLHQPNHCRTASSATRNLRPECNLTIAAGYEFFSLMKIKQKPVLEPPFLWQSPCPTVK